MFFKQFYNGNCIPQYLEGSNDQYRQKLHLLVDVQKNLLKQEEENKELKKSMKDCETCNKLL